MIKHIVIFKIQGAISFEEREEAARELSSIFSPLESLSAVTKYRTGVNISKGDAAWDFIIDSLFESHEKLREYQESSEHISAVKKASRIGKEKAVINYFIQKE